MERKIRYVAALKICVLANMFVLTGCNFFNNDDIDFQKRIVGNLYIQNQENDSVYDFVFAESKEVYAVVVEDCISMYYDSKNIILIQSHINDSYQKFYQVYYKDLNANSIGEALEKEEISKDLFFTKTKEMKMIWESN